MVVAKLPYGRGFVEIELERGSVVELGHIGRIRDIEGGLLNKLENPTSSEKLSRIVRNKRVLIIVTDKTRPTPNRALLPPLTKYIEDSGGSIKILIANGLHEPMSKQQILEFLGEDIYHHFEVVNHNAYDSSSILNLGETSYGTPIQVNRLVMDSDIVIGTGSVEPHFFAGYSGGRKIILPGVAGSLSIMRNHGFKMINSPYAVYGSLERNPIHLDMLEFMKRTKLDFIVNVTLLRKDVTGVFAGHPIKTHLDAVSYLDTYVRVRVKPADIVITTNGGYPLDRNLYQTVKAMATGELTVKKNGVIIVLSECIDGITHKEFHKLIVDREPQEILDFIRKNEPLPDQWEAHIMARVMKKAKIILVSRIPERRVEEVGLIPSKDADEALELAERIVGKDSSVLIIPEGPYTIPET